MLERLLRLMRNRESLKRMQRLLYAMSALTGLMSLITFFLPRFVPVLSNGIYTEASGALFIFFIFLLGYTVILSLIGINVRSIAERKEQWTSELGLKLKLLNFEIEQETDPQRKAKLVKEYEGLKLERDLLFDESPRRFGHGVDTAWGKNLVDSHNRLYDEENRLLARNVANLSYGGIASVVGVVILLIIIGFAYFNTPTANLSLATAPFYYFLCIPISVIIGILVVFFLRLYSQTEHRLEKNKNEMTNIELRLTACQLLESKTGKDKFDSLAETLSKEERNFVLKKNESSAIPETLDNEKLLEIISKLALKAGGI